MRPALPDRPTPIHMLPISSQLRGHVRPLLLSLLALLILASLAGCKADRIARTPQTTEQLIAARDESDRDFDALHQEMTSALLRGAKAEHDAYASGQSAHPPVVDMLVISGGGDWGAFAAGFLKGWEEISGEMAKPEFDLVTGVSTGALIAPFAFLGDPESTEITSQTYRNPKKDWVKPRGVISILRQDFAFSTVPGLERDIKLSLNKERIARIAAEREKGRYLLVNVTNVDTQESRVWDVTAEAVAATESGDASKLYEVLLASSALPGIFPPRKIDDGLYVDGGLTGNVLWGSPRANPEEETFVARWVEAYPELPIPKVRYWIIFNNEVRWAPTVVPGKWSSVLGASMTAGTRSATLTSIRLLASQARNAQLRHNADVQVRIVAVPDGWVAPVPTPFNKKTMNALADIGQSMGADPTSWRTSIP